MKKKRLIKVLDGVYPDGKKHSKKKLVVQIPAIMNSFYLENARKSQAFFFMHQHFDNMVKARGKQG